MAYNPNFNNDKYQNRNNNYNNVGNSGGGGGPSRSYNNGGGGGRGGRGGYNQGGGGGGGGWNRGGGNQGGNNNNYNKRGREDDYQQESNKRRNNDYNDNRRQPSQHSQSYQQQQQSPALSLLNLQQRIKDSIWGLGSIDGYTAEINIPELSNYLQSQYNLNSSTILSVFRTAITELPHKIPHYVALIAYLAQTSLEPLTSPGITSINSTNQIVTGLPARPISALPSRPVESLSSTIKVEKVEGDAEDGGDVVMELEGEEKVEIISAVRINVGKEIVKDLMSSLQNFLDSKKWRSVRYIILALSHLAALPSPLISPTAILSLLNLFSTSILDEPGLRANRGDECIRIIVESLIRLGPSSTSSEAEEITRELKSAASNYLSRRKIEHHLFGEGDAGKQFEDEIEILVSTLSSEEESSVTTGILEVVFDKLSKAPGGPNSKVEEYDGPVSSEALEALIIPVEIEELDISSKDVATEVSSAGLRGDEGIGYEGVRVYLKLFEDDSVPTPYDPSGTIIKSLIHDMISMYEVNRKECARILLELPEWILPGTFRSKSINTNSRDDEDDEPIVEYPGGKDWILENLIVESILTSLFSLPSPALPSSYYHSLLCELCRLSPSTVAPALGKCVRRLYAGLGAEVESGYPILDPEGIRRFAEWFSVHLSNFGFAWSWNDWVSDMELDDKHPKKVFVARVIELEIRLSYYDRVKGTIPEALYESGIMPDDAPGSNYTYEAEGNPFAIPAADLLRLMRSKGSIEEVETELSSLETLAQAEPTLLSSSEALTLKRDLAIQTILNVGSRSFSHFLNVLERYLPLIRSLSDSPESRLEILNTIASFWARNSQFHLIVINKFLQYRILDSENIVAYTFSTSSSSATEESSNEQGWSDIDKWITLKACLITILGRVKSASRKVELLKRESENKAKDEKVDEEEAMTVNTETSELTIATSQLGNVEKELNSMILEIIKQFSLLLPVGTGTDDWAVWWTEGWFREFCRTLAESKLLGSTAILEGVAALALDDKSMVSVILESAKAWNDFA